MKVRRSPVIYIGGLIAFGVTLQLSMLAISIAFPPNRMEASPYEDSLISDTRQALLQRAKDRKLDVEVVAMQGAEYLKMQGDVEQLESVQWSADCVPNGPLARRGVLEPVSSRVFILPDAIRTSDTCLIDISLYGKRQAIALLQERSIKRGAEIALFSRQ